MYKLSDLSVYSPFSDRVGLHPRLAIVIGESEWCLMEQKIMN